LSALKFFLVNSGRWKLLPHVVRIAKRNVRRSNVLVGNKESTVTSVHLNLVAISQGLTMRVLRFPPPHPRSHQIQWLMLMLMLMLMSSDNEYFGRSSVDRNYFICSELTKTRAKAREQIRTKDDISNRKAEKKANSEKSTKKKKDRKFELKKAVFSCSSFMFCFLPVPPFLTVRPALPIP
jgi:hypothetical protein